MEQEIKDRSYLELLRRKLEIVMTQRIRRKNEIMTAIKTQDRLSMKSGSWNGEAEIRKWRERN